jgi:flagellin
MALRIQNNVEAFNAHRNLSVTGDRLATSMERLSSGFRINRAADDAAGLAISERLRGQIGGLDQAQRNVQDAVSLVQTAEGSLTEVHAMLQRMRDLAVQHKNGSLSNNDRNAIQSEVNQLASEIERIGSSAEFNGIKVLNTTQSLSFQVGSGDAQVIAVSLISLGAQVGGLGVSFYQLTTTGVSDIGEIDAAINLVSAQRSAFGAVQNRLGYTLENAAIYQENLTASESRVRDVDMAKEMVNFTKLQILQQAGTSMLAQANTSSQGVLTLLG